LHTLGSPALDLSIADANSFYGELERLAQDMARRIAEVQKPPAPDGAPARAAADIVFLATNAIHSRTEREELRTASQHQFLTLRLTAKQLEESLRGPAEAGAGLSTTMGSRRS
jgi:hypothetical protein